MGGGYEYSLCLHGCSKRRRVPGKRASDASLALWYPGDGNHHGNAIRMQSDSYFCIAKFGCDSEFLLLPKVSRGESLPKPGH